MYSFVVHLTTVVLTPVYFDTLYLVVVQIIELQKEKQKTWPTILNYSRNVSYYSFLDCGVLYVDALLCSALDCVTALHLTAVYLKELYRLSDCLERQNTWSTSLHYSTIVSYCSVLYFDVLLCSTLDCVTALHLTAVYLKELYRLSDCLEQPNTWPTSLNYSTIVSYCSVLNFDVLLCRTIDCSVLYCSALKCIAHKYAHIVQHNI